MTKKPPLLPHIPPPPTQNPHAFHDLLDPTISLAALQLRHQLTGPAFHQTQAKAIDHQVLGAQRGWSERGSPCSGSKSGRVC